MLAAHFGWASPFYLLVLLSILIWGAAWRVLPSLTGHLGAPVPMAQVLPKLIGLYRVPRHLKAFLLSGLTMMSGMMIIPFISPVLVSNNGIAPAEITYIYLAGGLATFFSARQIGKLADRFGAQRMYVCMALVSIGPMLFMTHMPMLSLVVTMLFFPTFMVAISGRTIPLQALMTTIPDPATRGAFLSTNAAMQQIGSGLGALVGGLMLHTDGAGHIIGYGNNGWLAVGMTVLAVLWSAQVRNAAQGTPVASLP